MANEIVVIISRDRGNDGIDHDLLFLYPITTPITVNTVQVPLTKASTLPERVKELNTLGCEILTPAELIDLDEGDLAFAPATVNQALGETIGDAQTKATAIYNKIKQDAKDELAAIYQYSGTRFDAT